LTRQSLAPISAPRNADINSFSRIKPKKHGSKLLARQMIAPQAENCKKNKENEGF
jgi:hypothetical protein